MSRRRKQLTAPAPAARVYESYNYIFDYDNNRTVRLTLSLTFRRETELAEMYESRHQQQQNSAYTPPSGSSYVSDEVLPVCRRLHDTEPHCSPSDLVSPTTLLMN